MVLASRSSRQKSGRSSEPSRENQERGILLDTTTVAELKELAREMGIAGAASVFAVTQRIKPQVYPKVEDEATIVLTYPKTQGIIQASWNWPFDRKDMEIYGQTGYALVPRMDVLRVRKANAGETEITPPPLTGPLADPLSCLAAVVRGDIQPSGLSSLAVNLIVTEILDAARESARTGQRVELPSHADKQ